MRILTNISDVRKYRQLGKQVNQDYFDGLARESQTYELTELLGDALAYEFFNSFDEGWTTQAGTYTRDKDYQFTATGQDLSAWTGYALKINDQVFVTVKSATFGGVDTVVVVEGYVLPSELNTIEFKTDNKYVLLLNGEIYQEHNNDIKFDGVRPFLIWTFLSTFTSEANVKHSDVGSFSIMPENRPRQIDLNEAKSTRKQNTLREQNRIVNYLNEKSSTYPLWSTKGNENITNLEMIII